MPETMTPSEIVSESDKHIIGQHKAKKAVVVALHNRWRRQQVGDPLRQEITPKNILVIGPIGMDKIETVCRLAELADVPFIKIKATKLTEAGCVGRGVDTIVCDLAGMAIKQAREPEMRKVRAKAEDVVEDCVLDVLIPSSRGIGFTQPEEKDSVACQIFCKKLRGGQLDDKEIELGVSAGVPSMNIMSPSGMEDMTEQIRSMFAGLGQGKKNRRKMKVSGAFRLLIDEEAARLVNEDELKQKAVVNVEQSDTMLLDEIDKVVSRDEYSGSEVSRQDAQRDLLPLVEGTTVNIKYGTAKADYILFVTSDAFHLSKLSDLIPELQNCFPIRVELDSLSVEDFHAILTQTDASLTKQCQTLLKTEGVSLVFAGGDTRCLARIAYSANEKIENIDARYLHTVMERLLEDPSFHAYKSSGEAVTIGITHADERLSELSGNEDLPHYVL